MSSYPVFDVLSSSDLDLDLNEKEDELWSCMSSPKDFFFSHDSILNLATNEDGDSNENSDVSNQMTDGGCSDVNEFVDLDKTCAVLPEDEKSTLEESDFMVFDDDIDHVDTNEIKNHLQLLKHSVPTDLINDQTSTTSILRGASNYIQRLRTCLQNYDKEHFATTTHDSHCQCLLNSMLYFVRPCSSPIHFYRYSSTMTSSYHGHFSGGTLTQVCPSQATNNFTSIKEKKNLDHSVPFFGCNTFNPFLLTNSSMQYGLNQFHALEQTTLSSRYDPDFAPASPQILTKEIHEQFRNDYPALSSVLDELSEETIPTTDKQNKEEDNETDTVSSSRKNSDSTDTDIDLSFNADDDNVFLENCANPDDVSGFRVSSADEPDSTTEGKVLKRNKAERRKGVSESLRRPKNGFIRFSVEYRKRLAQQRPNVDNREVSKMLGAKWRRMSQEEKEPYENEFRNDIENLKKKHPEWRYAPMKRLSHDQLEPMPSRLRPRDKLKKKFPATIAKGTQLPRMSPPSTGKAKGCTNKKRGKLKRDKHNLVGFRWMQCCICYKWRYVPFFSNTPKTVPNSFWYVTYGLSLIDYNSLIYRAGINTSKFDCFNNQKQCKVN